jgi:hypothetical protein
MLEDLVGTKLSKGSSQSTKNPGRSARDLAGRPPNFVDFPHLFGIALFVDLQYSVSAEFKLGAQKHTK